MTDTGVMRCQKCNGRMFLDRTFSDNKSFEIYCMMCGHRKFVDKKAELGKWLTKKEKQLASAGSLYVTSS